MKKISKYLVILFTILIIFFNGLYLLKSNAESLFIDLKKLEKKYFRGILYNESYHDFNIVDFPYIRTVPAQNSSKNVGIYDTDALIINKPTIFLNREYDTGVIRFCDLASVRVYTKDNIDIVIPSFGFRLCKFIGRYGWFESKERAFPLFH